MRRHVCWISLSLNNKSVYKKPVESIRMTLVCSVLGAGAEDLTDCSCGETDYAVCSSIIHIYCVFPEQCTTAENDIGIEAFSFIDGFCPEHRLVGMRQNMRWILRIQKHGTHTVPVGCTVRTVIEYQPALRDPDRYSTATGSGIAPVVLRQVQYFKVSPVQLIR